MGKVSLHLIGTNGVHAKAEKERFSAVHWSRVVVRTSNLEILRRRLVVKKFHQSAYRTCSAIIFPAVGKEQNKSENAVELLRTKLTTSVVLRIGPKPAPRAWSLLRRSTRYDMTRQSRHAC